AVAHAWDPDRGGDLYVVLEEGSVFDEDMVTGFGTGHGSPRPYDTDVPLVFYGAGIIAAPQRPNDPVPQESVAGTLARLLGAPAPPSADAPPLSVVLVK